MPFYRYFTKNNAQGVVLNDTSSQITFQAGHTLPTSISSGEFLLTLGGPGGEIVKVTNAAQDGSGVLTVDVTREQESSSYLDATSGTVGYLYLTAGMFNKAYDILEEHETKLNYMTITQAVNLDTLESDTATNNAKVSNYNHTGDVTGSTVLGIVPAAISGRTTVTPVSGDYILVWDATDSALKKVDASNFLNLVTSVNGFTGTVTLVTGNISDTTSTQKYATAAQLAKVDYLTITQAVDLDTLESNTTTNNAKVTNATHTGDVTGADVLGIVPAAISGKTSVTAVSGDYVLLWDATDSTLKKANVSDFIGGGAVDSVNGLTGVVTLVTGNISDTTSTQKYTTASDITKLSYISVTQAVDLDTIESNTATNNAKVTNADHTGDVTGSAGLVIVPSAISGKSIVTPVSGDYVLLWDATDSALKKVDASNFLGGAVSSVNSFTGAVTLVTGNISDTTSTQKYTTAADITKLGYISVTQAVDLDTMESNITTNNAKVTNATHTGEVTGSGALVIDPTAISGKTSVTPVSGDYLLLWDLTDSTLKKVDASNFLGGAVSSVNTFTGAVTLVTGNISDTTSTQKYTTAANLTKIGFISVTQAVDLDTMESNIATNNAKVTNANHTGDVTGADVLGIVPAAISGKTGVTPVAGDYVLLWDATDSTLKKADVTTFITGGGDVTGPASSTNTGIAIFNGTGGKTLMNSLVTIDTSSVTIPGFLTVTGQARNPNQTALTTSGIVTWNIKNDPKANIILAGDVTSLTVSGIELNGEASLYIKQHASTAYDITWPVTITWAGGVSPDISELDSFHVVSFYSYDGTGLIGAHVGSSLISSGAVASVNGFTGTVTLVTGNISDTTSTQKYTTAADITKLGFIDVTSSIDLNTLSAAVTLNTAKVTNAAHTGDVTGADVLGIVPAAISGRTSVTAVSGDYVLLWDATDSALKKANVSDFIGGGAVDSVNGFTGVVTLVTGNISDTTSTQKYATAAQLAKVDFISVTQAVDLDTMESNISTNNAKVTNANHTGDVTGADVLGIVPAAISGKTGVTPVAGDYVLIWDATDSALKKADVTAFIDGGVTSVNSFTGAVTLVTGNISDTTSTQKYTTTANLTKMGFISVTQAVDLDTMESNIATNNAKVTNANHTGDVTGGDVLGIVPAAISGKTGVTPVAGDYVLLWDATDSTLKKADVTSFVNGSYGDVTGPASSTNTGIAIYNGTGGKTLMNSLVTIDTSSVTVPGFLTITGQVRNAAQTALSTSAIVTWNVNNDPKASIAMTSDVTSFTISGININSNAILYVKQHASAAKTITWPATIKWSGNTTPDISNLNSINVFSFYSYDGTGLIGTHVTDQTSSFTPNANHTGDVTGSGVLGIVPAAISGRTGVTPVAGDYVLLWDATDSTLKKADVTDFISAVTASSTTTFTSKRITKRVTTLTDAATIAINSDNMDMGKVTLTASRTLGTPTGTPTDGQQLLLEVVQGGSGSYTLTPDSTSTAGSYRFGSDVTGFTLSTAVGKKDLILLTYLSDITGFAVTAISKGYPA